MASLQNVTFEMNREEINAMLQVILPAHFIPLLFIWLYVSFLQKKRTLCISHSLTPSLVSLRFGSLPSVLDRWLAGSLAPLQLSPRIPCHINYVCILSTCRMIQGLEKIRDQLAGVNQ